VQVDALRAYVALARPLPVPDVRAAASGVLGTTFTATPRAGVHFVAELKRALTMAPGSVWKARIS
jgi:hypothetical protein